MRAERRDDPRTSLAGVATFGNVTLGNRQLFANLFSILLPCGILPAFDALGAWMVWMTVPFTTLVAWVYLTTDQIGDWSENPFEGLPNDVPITSMARGIERDIRQLDGQSELPPPRQPDGMILF